MPKLLSTVAKRRAVARRVSEVATRALGMPVALKLSDLYPGEFGWRAEDLESERGPVRHIYLDVSRRGVSVHIKFGFPEFSPGDRAKWNHYLWPEAGDTLETFTESMAADLQAILRTVKLRPGIVRHDRPSMLDKWAVWREEFARECAARAAS